ncbi:tetratricopeptide repeat protein [Marinobacterium mangrovicola]|uniref:Tetratricopeptide repeat protein n=1 Tax=Marinobacterium mangrovicola TaxID=1476959 RepID=A0A4R1GA95_9GAMM|nr:hypothetical protein [Marinobacterium mangrovicola]TCK03621.1 hypothetical protein CLV83_3895 [Marinobacterium mangrovicola]
MRLILIPILITLLAGCASSGTDLSAKAAEGQTLTETWKAADIAYQQKEWEKSFQLYKQISTQMEDANVEFRMGVSAFRLHYINQAEASFERTLVINPSHRKALFNLAIINMSRGYAFLNEYTKNLPEDERSSEILDVLSILEKFSSQ